MLCETFGIPIPEQLARLKIDLKYESDFSEYLIVHYSKKHLEEAYDTLINSTSVASLKGDAYRIALDKKKKTGSCKIGELTTFVKKAIDGFDLVL